jgi:phosphohistidine phosphatase
MADRTLIVMRHAKSSWKTSEPDHRRPLSKRGARDAAVAGEILAGYAIDRVLASSATRTRQTWETAVLGGASAAEVTFTDDLYGCWAGDVIALLQQLPDELRTVLVLGHEPTMSELIEELAAPSDLADAAISQFTTSALAVLECHAPWKALVGRTATVVRHEVPRG